MIFIEKKSRRLSFATGREENELAQITLDFARKSSTAGLKAAAVEPASNQVESTLDDSRAHIGEYLLGKSRAEFEERIGYHPDFKTALKRWGLRHASVVYLGSIIVLSILIFMFLALVSNLPVFLFSCVSTATDHCFRVGNNPAGSRSDKFCQPDQLDGNTEYPSLHSAQAALSKTKSLLDSKPWLSSLL